MPGEEPDRKDRRGLQGTPADRQSRIRGVRLAIHSPHLPPQPQPEEAPAAIRRRLPASC